MCLVRFTLVFCFFIWIYFYHITEKILALKYLCFTEIFV